ncbi:MAG: Crp/Fnr family transcriptional regulator [Chitinophagaceae bacterium]
MNLRFEHYLKKNMGVSDSQLEGLLPSLKIKFYPRHSFLLREGGIAVQSYYIEQGLVRSYSIDEKGRQHIIQFAPEDWFIGERSSVYFHIPSLFSIETIEDTTVVIIDQDYINYVSRWPVYQEKNELSLQTHIRHLQNRINLLLGASAETRYLEFIRLYPGLPQRVPQWMIASYLGINPESLSRVRKEITSRSAGQQH